jgi:hypothetical protein
MNFFYAYFGRFSCANAHILKGLLGHKNPVPNYNIPLSRKQTGRALLSTNRRRMVAKDKVLTVIVNLTFYVFDI